MRISVVGLGKLGAPLFALFASRGVSVIGVDANPAIIAALGSGKSPVFEPGVQELLDASPRPLQATTDLATAVQASDATFVIVPTPSAPEGSFSPDTVLDVVRGIGAALRSKDQHHLVVIVSTLTPGSMDGAVRPSLEAAAGRLLGDRLGLCYCPEFVALGAVIPNMRRPDFVLIGESDNRAGDQLSAIFGILCDAPPQIARMNFINAELSKLAVNAFVTMKISYANMISELCDRLPGADAAIVTTAIGHDSRISPKYLFPALGYGGPCFPRDALAMAALARKISVSADLADATERVNRRQAERVATLVRERLRSGTVAVLGVAYKPQTNVCEESQGVTIAGHLAESGYRVLVSDPQALTSAKALLGDRVEAVASHAACVRMADLVIIATPWQDFADLERSDLSRADKRLTIIDCWRMPWLSEFADLVDLVYLGRAPANFIEPSHG